MKTFTRTHHLLFVASLAAALGGLVFACGSEDGGGPCEGAACLDGGGSESSTPEGSTSDGPLGDAPTDSPDDGRDSGACKLEGPDPDAGPSGTLQWALNFGVSGYTYPSTVARDPANGDIVVTGYFWGTTDFGGGPLTSVAANDGSGSDVFVARFEKDGVYKWAGAWGNGSNFAANAVAVGPSGEMVVGGTIREGSIDFGNGCDVLTSTGSPDIFLVQFDKVGLCVWSKRFGVAGETQNINAVGVDAAGNIILTGIARGGLSLGGPSLDGFVIAKLASNGAHVWSKAFVATTAYGGPHLALDPQGNPILAGSFSKVINLGGGPLVTAGADAGSNTIAAFAAKFDPSGKHQWSRHYGEGTGAKNAAVTGVATDACGNVVLHGHFSGNIDFGVGPLTAADTTKSYIFLSKLSAVGTGVWSKAFVGSNGGNAPAFGVAGVAVSAAGEPTISPRLMGGIGYQSTADFGGGPLTSIGRGTIAIATLDSTAKHRWSYGGGAPSTATASFAAFPTAAAGWGPSVVVTGAFNRCTIVCDTAPAGTTLVLAGKTLNGVSGQDLFIASFTP